MSNLRIGLPSKGRLAADAETLLHEAGLSFRRQDRSLFARVREMPCEVTFLRQADIPILCAEGALDLGVCGSDVVEESGVALTKRLALGIGRCRLAICVPQESGLGSTADLSGARLATSFPRSTRTFLTDRGVTAHLVPVSGSVEVMTALGVADAVVDLVETGSTLAANRLRILEEIAAHEAWLVQSPAGRRADVADRVVRRLEGVVIARSWTLLEYNVPRARLADAEAVTPGYDSPTVSALEDPEWCSVKVMVRRAEVAEVMEKLEAIGASAILETRIANCRL